MIKVRDVRPDDAPRLAEIYDHYVTQTAVSFEYVTPSGEEFRDRILETIKNYPYLVAIADGSIMGYAYAHPFVGREAYRFSAETTIYVDHNAQHKGIGRALYTALEGRLKGMGIKNLYACIGYPPDGDDEFLSTNSADFHAHMGFVKVGDFHRCGYKFGRWYDMIWMEKIIKEPL